MLYKVIRKKLLFLCITSAVLMIGCGQNKNTDVVEVLTEEIPVQTETVEEETKEETPTDNQNETKVIEQEKQESAVEIESEETKEETEEETIAWDKEKDRVKIKGIYISGPIAGNKRMDELIDLVDTTELNAMVIDIKNDDGQVTYKMDSPLVNEVGSTKGYIRDIDELVNRCKEKNIYLIARIVAFKDPLLAEAKPELAIHLKDGSIYRDNKKLAWVNPYETEVWDYLKEIAIEAAKVGFDEIQFDYIRFSTDIKESQVNFGENAIDKSKIDIITEFTKYISEELEPYEVFVAADVYGTIIDSKVDQKIVGQDYVQMSSYLDYICPMVYPSHYANGVYGIAIPDANPYKTINSAMNAATKELEVLGDSHKAINRVWLQSFTASWVNGHISYGPKQIRDQIKGAYDAGYDEWILWNASMKYQKDSLLSDEDALAEKEKWDEELASKKQEQESKEEQE